MRRGHSRRSIPEGMMGQKTYLTDTSAQNQVEKRMSARKRRQRNEKVIREQLKQEK